MKRLLGFQSIFLSVILCGVIVLSTATALAQMPEEQESSYYPDAPIPVLPEQPEAWVVTGHPVGDSIGRALDFAFGPVYEGGSWVWFSVFKPSEPYHITQLMMTGCPEEPEPVSTPETAPPAQAEEEKTPQAQPQEEPTAPPSAQ